MAERHYPQYAKLVSPTTLDSTAMIGSYHGELLQIHGEEDQVVPIELAHRLFAAGNYPKKFLSLAAKGHDLQTSEIYTSDLVRFIEDWLLRREGTASSQ